MAGATSRSPFVLAFKASLGVALAYGLVLAVVAVRSDLVLILVAGFLAIGLDPAVQWLGRRGLRRTYAVGVGLLAALLVFAGFGLALGPPVVDQVQQFIAAVPGYVRDLQANEQVARLDERYHFL